MGNIKRKLILSVFVVLSLVILTGNGWSQQIGLPHAFFDGLVETYLDNGANDDLVFLYTSIFSITYADGTSGSNDSILWSTVTITGSKRNPLATPGTTFTPATLTVSDGTTIYLSATLKNIEFVPIGGLWRLNPDLDINNPPTLNLDNLVLNPGPIPSRYIQDLQAALGSQTIAGMTMTLDILAGDITGDSQSVIFEGLIDGVPLVAPNAPPKADAGATTTNTTCLTTTCSITLNGSQSTDPDGVADIVSYQWFKNNVLIASGAIVNVSLPLGMHDITLKVTDSAGNTDEVTIIIVIDPTELSYIEIESAHVKDNGLINIKGRLALPAGISYLNVNSVGHATIGVSTLGNVINQSVDFTESSNRNKWQYDANPVFGIDNFKIDWKGSKFSYQDPLYNLSLKTLHIGEAETSLKIKSCAPVTIVINGVTVTIDEQHKGTCSNASSKVDRDNDGEDDDEDDDLGDNYDGDCKTNVTLPFALTPDMVIEITHGTVTDSVSVADHYIAAVGKFKLSGKFNATGISFSSLVPNLTLTVALGDQGFSGTLVINQVAWTKIKPKQWVYDPN